MLKLLIFAPCEKVIIGQEHTSSLISVIEGLTVNTNEKLPPNAVLPMKWAILTLWQREKEVEQPITFEQKIEVIRPDGENLGGGLNVFNVNNDHRNFRNTLQLEGLHVGVEGDILVKLFLREAGEGNEWRAVAEYPVVITHKPIEVESEKSGIENAEGGGVHALSGANSTPDGSAEEGSGQAEGQV